MTAMNMFLLPLLALFACSDNTESAMAYDAPIAASSLEVAARHDAWDALLKAHVHDGLVDYKGFVKDKDKLNAYCEAMSATAPSGSWSKNTQLAYWINVYNARTVQLIVDNYPVNSIQDLHPTLKIPTVNTVWHKKKFMVGDTEYSLNDVEHEVLRKKFDEPRIHFAINCASISCPPLRNEAYTEAAMNKQLEEQARLFINTERYNRISTDKVMLSKIFDWFKGDFEKNGPLLDYLNKYSKVKVAANAEVDHLEYDWSLNEKK